MKKVLLLFCMGLSLQSMTASEFNNNAKAVYNVAITSDGAQWLDFASANFEGGEGTVESPYLINTPEQLAKLAKDVYDGKTYSGTYFKMVADIDLNGHAWFPIGYKMETTGTSFAGYFDGDGHKIMNIKIPYEANYKGIGLFGNTEADFELRNLTIESGDIAGDMLVGSLVGSNYGLIENCVNKASVACLFYYVGGIAGSNYSTGVIKNCINYGDILAGYESANGMSAGGVVGSNYNLVEECVNFGSIDSKTSGSGGIVAMLEGGVVRNCFNMGVVNGADRIGGIIGEALGRGGNCEVYSCYNAGKIGDGSTAGGVLGLAMFQNMNKLDMHNIYYSSDSFAGSYGGNVMDLFGTYQVTDVTSMSVDDMKAESFVATLNAASGSESDVWVADTKNINNGYPILSFMENQSTGITSQKFSDNVKVYTTGGRIVVEGAEGKSMQVYSVDGQMVYNGKAADLNPTSGMYIVRVNNKSYKLIVK